MISANATIIRPQVFFSAFFFVRSVVGDADKLLNVFFSGIIGTKYLFPLFLLLNRTDVAFSVAIHTSYPSYAFMFLNSFENATTLWELWESPFKGASMNSRNHIMFGRYVHEGSIIHPCFC